MTTKIQIIEDDPHYAKLLIGILDSNPLLTFAGIATTKAEALDMLKSSEVADVFLLDVGLPDGSGLDLIKPILNVKPSAAIILLSTLGARSAILSGINLGAVGYVMKSTSPDAIVQHIFDALNHGATLSPSLIKIAIDAAKNPVIEKTESPGLVVHSLTPREVEILNLLKDAHPSKRIASMLQVSKFTVSQHLRNVYRKLEAKNRVEAISIARLKKIIQ
jgi:DNA-binding NarL/FixJ family response regulator